MNISSQQIDLQSFHIFISEQPTSSKNQQTPQNLQNGKYIQILIFSHTHTHTGNK